MTRLARLPPGSEASLHSWNAWGMQAEEEGKFDYPERDENDEHLDNRFNHVLNQYPDVDI